MRVLYIGHYDEGSTSKMRGEYLRKLLQPSEMVVINTDEPMRSVSRLFKTIGWRYKRGPMISKINEYIITQLNKDVKFDVAWIDKGVFIEAEIIFMLRRYCNLMVHYTPDPAFYFHQSHHFRKALPVYDYCVTTKPFEVDIYYKNGAKKVLQCTQGYDPAIHKKYYDFKAKEGVVFVGHREDDREEGISLLLQRNIQVKLAGLYWERFSYKHRNNSDLQYLGKGVFGDDYSRLISGSLMGLGFLSRIIPEKHTTRTFEIPACYTALVTERTEETASFYNDNEAVFYNSLEEMADKVSSLIRSNDLANITEAGYKKVKTAGFDYEHILTELLIKMHLYSKAT